jgi:hypothetical protein
MYPTAIVKRRPAPGIVRYPSIAIFSHCPITIGAIGPKSIGNIRIPYITITGIIVPITVWRQLVIKDAKRHFSIYLSICFRKRKEAEKCDENDGNCW